MLEKLTDKLLSALYIGYCETHTSPELWISAIQLKNLDSRFFSDLPSIYESWRIEDCPITDTLFGNFPQDLT
jgi:hypothetical protein